MSPVLPPPGLHTLQDTWPEGPEPRGRRAVWMPDRILADQPGTCLAPMQDVTDIDFMRLVASRGAPDWFVTEYFRVHAHSTPERHILRSALENDTGRPVFAQLLGEHVPDLVRTAVDLLAMPWAGIDLNLGCPAPKIYRKNVGGGLLRDPDKLEEILGALRGAIPGRFTVKLRIGFEDTRHFERLMGLLARHRVDLVTLHARTVREMYRSGVHYEYHRRARDMLPCALIANGNVDTADKALRVLEATGADGLMVGRAAIRNPWIFGQIRDRLSGAPSRPVTLAQVAEYIRELRLATARPDFPERQHVNKLKKYLNFVGLSVDPEGAFLRDARRAENYAELEDVLGRHLLSTPDALFADAPYPGLIARPSREAPGESEGCSL